MARSVLSQGFRKGDTISARYQVQRKLGEGGCGAVYRCRDKKRKGEDVAVKILSNPSDMPRFRREARVMHRASSRHVVKLLDRGVHDQRWPYLVMEFMDGGSVRDLLDRRSKMPPAEAAWILVQALRGIRATGSVHRDLKPENLLLKKGGKGRGYTFMPGDVDDGAVIKVTDFGLAKSSESDSVSLTHSGQVMGTPVYMSPEQCRNTKRVSVKTDIYALGVILYEMVCGRPPFDASNSYDIMAMHCSEEPNLRRVPNEVRDICARCLQKSPGKRYPSLAALERDLSKVAGLETAGVGASYWGVTLIGAAVLVGALGAAGWYWQEELIGFWNMLRAWESGAE